MVAARIIVVLAKLRELLCQILRSPERHVIKQLSPDRSYQPFYE